MKWVLIFWLNVSLGRDFTCEHFLCVAERFLSCGVFLCIHSPVEMIKSLGVISCEGNEITEAEHVLGIICLLIQPRVYVLPVIWLPLQQRNGLAWRKEIQTPRASESSSSEFIDMHGRKITIFTGPWSTPGSLRSLESESMHDTLKDKGQTVCSVVMASITITPTLLCLNGPHFFVSSFS